MYIIITIRVVKVCYFHFIFQNSCHEAFSGIISVLKFYQNIDMAIFQKVLPYGNFHFTDRKYCGIIAVVISTELL